MIDLDLSPSWISLKTAITATAIAKLASMPIQVHQK
jgi:hypothetical protein